MQVDACVFGAAGYSGLELLKLLAQHPSIRVVGAASDAHAGRAVRALTGAAAHASLVFEKTEALLARKDAFSAAFLCVPLDAARALTAALGARAVAPRIVDLSHAQRPGDRGDARGDARGDFAPPDAGVAYGLTALFSADVAGASLVANPGCYATAVIMAVAPLVRAGVVSSDIVVNAVSGTTGAGRSKEEALSLSEMHGNVRAYKVLAHQHVPEIEAALARVSESPSRAPRVCLTTHLLPVARGIFVTATCRLTGAHDTASLLSLYRDAYARDPFVTLADSAEDVSLRAVVGTNQCMIGLKSQGTGHAAVKGREGDGFVVVTAALDNLLKGAAGQALENMNLLFGFDRTAGLTHLSRSS